MPSMPLIYAPPPLVAVTNMEHWWRVTAFTPGMTSAAPTANQAVYTPIMVSRPTDVRKLLVFNGSAVAGNVDLGLYAIDSEGKPGARICSTGAIAQAGTDTFQKISPTLTGIKVSGTIYVASSFSSASARVRAILAGAIVGVELYLGGVFVQAAAHPLPSTATPVAASASVTIPILGLGDFLS